MLMLPFATVTKNHQAGDGQRGMVKVILADYEQRTVILSASRHCCVLLAKKV